MDDHLRQSERTCPVCHMAKGELLHTVTAAQAAQHFIREDAEEERHHRLRTEIERLWGGATCEIVECKGCGFIYANPYVAGRESFYGMFLHAPSYPQDRFEFAATERALRRIHEGKAAAPRGQLLEVGAGDGAFVRRVTPSLFPREGVLCTEFSSAGESAIRQLGVECVGTDVRNLRGGAYEGRFGAICMFQVLEHLDKLDDLWEAFNYLTSAGADLFLSVPSDKWINYQERACGQLDMPPNHVGRWNRRAFETIGSRHGWKIVDHQYESCSKGQLARAAATSLFFHARSVNGSATDRMTRIHNRRLRRLCSIPAFGFWYAVASVRTRGLDASVLGVTQWAHLRRE